MKSNKYQGFLGPFYPIELSLFQSTMADLENTLILLSNIEVDSDSSVHNHNVSNERLENLCNNEHFNTFELL